MKSVRAYALISLGSFAVMVAALTGAVSSWSASALAPDATLSIDPPTKTVNAGDAFTINVKQDVIAAVAGTQTDVLFDQTRLQITGVAKGAAFTGSSFFIGVAPHNNAPEAIAEANTTGRLRNMAASFNPGAGSVAAGATTAFTLTMSAKADASGSTDVTLDKAEVLDASFGSLTVATVKGTIVVNNANVLATNTATVTPTPSATVTPGGPTLTPTPTPTNTAIPPTNTATNTAVPPTNTPTGTLTPAPSTATFTSTPTRTNTVAATNTSAATSTPFPTLTSTPIPPKGSIVVVPASVPVSPNTDFTININQDANFTTTGTLTNIEFDPSLLQITSVDRAEPFTRAGSAFVAGVVPDGGTQQTLAQAIAEANQTGRLKKVSAYYLPGGGSGHVDTGANTFLIVKMKSAAKEGTSPITLDHVIDATNDGLVLPGGDYAGPEMLDLDGNTVRLAATNGEVVVKAGSPPPPTVVPVVAAVSSPVSSSGTPRAAGSTSTGSTGTTLGTSSRPGTVLGSSTPPTGLPRTGDGATPDGRMLALALAAALSTLGFGGLAAAGFARQRRRL